MKNKNCNLFYLFLFLLLTSQSLIGQTSVQTNTINLSLVSTAMPLKIALNDENCEYEKDHSSMVNRTIEKTNELNFSYLNSILMPMATLSVDVDEVCLFDTEPVLTFTGSNGTPPYTFVYTVDGAMAFTDQIMTTDMSSSVTLLHPTDIAGATTYQIVEVMDASGESAPVNMDPIDIVVNNIPEGSIEAIDEISCVGGEEPEIIFYGDGSAPFTFTYTVNGGAQQFISTSGNDNQVSLFHPTSSSDEYEYELIKIQDNIGCTNEVVGQSLVITILDGPEVIEPSSDETIEYCEGDQAPDISFSFTGDSPFEVTYVNEASTFVVSGVSSPLTIPNADAGTYVITSIIDANGCSTPSDYMSNSITVIENPGPTPTIEIDPDQTSFCEGDDFTLSISGLTGNSNDYSYSWALADGTTSNNETVLISNATTADEGTYTLTVTDDNTLCNSVVSVEININPLPEVMTQVNLFDGTGWNFVNVATVCEGTSEISFAGFPVESETWFWSGPNGFNSTSRVINLQNITLDMEGIYDVTYTDDNGCMDSGSIELKVDPLPSLIFEGANCSPDLLTYDITFTSNGTVSSTEGTVSGDMVTGIPVGTDVILTAESMEGCEFTLAVTAPDCDCPFVELPVNDGDQSICEGESNPTLSVSIAAGLSANWYLESQSGGTILTNGEETLTYTPVVSLPGNYEYWVEGLDPNTGCVSDTRTLVVLDINPLPNVTLMQVDPVCINTEVFDLTGLPAGGVFSGDGITDATNGTFDPSIAGVGIHTIVYTFTDPNSCVNSDAIDIIVNSLPTLEVITAECSTDLLTYTVEFNSNGTVSSTDGTVVGNTVIGIPTGQDVTLTAVSSEGCEEVEEVTAPECDCETVPNPINNGDQTVCEGEENPILSVNVNAGLSANWYTEPAGGVILADGEETLTYQPDVIAPGVYLFYVESIDPSNGCVSMTRTIVELTILELPDVTLNQGGPFCINESPSNLTGLPTGGEFSGDGIVNAVVGTFDPVVAGPGVHTITYTYIDSDLCENSDTKEIIVNVLPDVSIENIDPVCINEEPFNLQGNPSGTGGEFSGDGITDPSAGTFDPILAGIGIHTITYVFVDNNSCENSATIDIEVNSLADFVVNSASCTSDLSSYTIDFTTNADDIQSTAGTVDLVQNIISNIPADQDVTITIISIDNCEFSIEFMAPNCDCLPIDEPINNGDASICFGELNPELSVSTTSGDISANWYEQASGGSPLNAMPTLAYTPSQTLPGVYIFYVESIDINSGCFSTSRTQVNFIINTLPEPIILPDNPVFCENSSVILDAGPFQSWLWSDNSMNQTLEVFVEGTYSVTVSDENECTGTNSVTVSSGPSPFVSSPNNNVAVEFCANETAPNIEFTLSGIAPFEAEYTLNGGPPQEGTVVNDKLIIFEALPGVYEVVSITDNSCETSDSYVSNSITVIENPVPEFNIIKTPVNNDLVCNGADFILTTDLDQEGFLYNWSTPVGAFSTETLEFNNISPSYGGDYFLTITTNSAIECSFSTSKEINISVVSGSITTNTGINKICSGESITLIAEGVPSENGITWLNGVPAGEENNITVEVSPNETTTYDAILRNSEGCERNASYTIVVNPLPNPVIVSDDALYCSGSLVTLSTEDPYSSYMWSNNGTSSSIIFSANTNDTNYQVTVTDENDCTQSDEIELQITTSPNVDIFTQTVNLPAGATADFQAVNPTTATNCNVVSYEWYVDGVFIDSTVDPEFSYTFITQGETEVCVLLNDDCGCASQLNCQEMIIFENGQCIVSFKELDNLCLDQESTLVANPIPGTVDGANNPQEGYFIVEGISIDEDFKNNFLNVEVGDPGRRFTVSKVLFKDKPFANADKFLDSIKIEFKNPIEYNYQFYYDFGLCVKTSSLRSANVQSTPSFLDIIIDDEACFGESPILDFDISPNQSNFRMRYEVNGEAFTIDFLGNNDFIQFGPQTNPNVDLEINLIELINFKDGEISQATGCSTNDISPSNIIIDVLPDVVYSVQDSCDEDGLNVQYSLEFEGGTGIYSLNGVGISGNTFVSPFIESGQSQTYTLVDEGCDEENSDLITLSTECETCVLFEEIIEDQNIIVDGDKNVCSSDLVNFSLDKAPEISNNQIVVYAVLTEASQFYDESIILFDSIPTDPASFEFDINSHPSLETGVDYFVTAFIFNKQATGFKADITCAGINPKTVTFYDTPTADIVNLEDDLNICLNEFDFQLGIDNTPNISTLSSSNSEVQITYIEGDTRALISVGDIAASDFTITLNQTNLFNIDNDQLMCSGESNLVLNVLDRQAPTKDTIIAWPGFMYSFVGEGLCYQWGFNDNLLEGETDRFYIKGDQLEEGDVLWIDVWDCDDSLKECVSTIYYNATEPPKIEVKPLDELNYQLNPNPNNGQFELQLEGLKIGLFEVRLFSSTGQLMSTLNFEKQDFIHKEYFQFDALANGLYILNVRDENGENRFIKFLKH